MAEVGQSAAARNRSSEVREESGPPRQGGQAAGLLRSQQTRAPAIPFHNLFHCELFGDAPMVSSETTEVGFYRGE